MTPEAFIEQHGLLLAQFHVNDLPTDSQQSLGPACKHTSTVYLLANAGAQFWESHRMLSQSAMSSDREALLEPVDRSSYQLALLFARECLRDDNATVLFPDPDPDAATMPLMSLGRLAGWGVSSPLGLAVHPRFGPWIAFRALVLSDHSIASTTAATLAARVSEPDTNVCLRCDAKPCVTTCPAKAVSVTEPFDVARCFSHRNTTGSSCRNDCAARRACPVGPEHAYSEEQLSWHMEHSLASIARWLA